MHYYLLLLFKQILLCESLTNKMRLISLLLMTSFFGFTCEEENQDYIREETSKTKKAIVLPKEDSIKINERNLAPDFYPDSLILLKRFSKSYPQVYNTIIELEKAIKGSNKINDDEGLLELLDIRDKLAEAINISGVFYDVYDEEGSPNYETAFENFEKELNSLGFQEQWAEGFYIGISKALFMEELFETKASEPLKLKTRIFDLYGYTGETEYPLLGLSAESEIIFLGEQMFAKYRDHNYTKHIQEIFEESLMTLFDFHAVYYGDGKPTFINFDLSTRAYPNWTEIHNRENFIKEYPDSKYVPLMEKVLVNLSSINVENDSIFIVQVPSKVTKIIEFLNKGIVIPNVIELRDSKGVLTKTVCAYRFYSDKTKAEQALKLISEKIPDSKIVIQLIDRTY